MLSSNKMEKNVPRKMCLFDNKLIYHSKDAVTEWFICVCACLEFFALTSKYLVEKNKQNRTA